MPTISDNAVCLRRWDFSETSQTVALFTREHGMIRGLAKGAKRPRGGFSGGFDLLARGQIVAIIKPSRDLATLTEWHLEEVYRACRESLAANRAGLYMADLVQQMLEPHDAHPILFDALTDALPKLSATESNEPILLRFQLALLKEAGYEPQLEQDAKTGETLDDEIDTLAFSSEAGGVVTDSGGSDRWRVRRSTVELLRAVQTERSPDVDATTWRRANLLLAAYIRDILGHEPHAMRWAFSDLPGGTA